MRDPSHHLLISKGSLDIKGVICTWVFIGNSRPHANIVANSTAPFLLYFGGFVLWLNLWTARSSQYPWHFFMVNTDHCIHCAFAFAGCTVCIYAFFYTPSECHKSAHLWVARCCIFCSFEVVVVFLVSGFFLMKRDFFKSQSNAWRYLEGCVSVSGGITASF